MSNRVFHMIRPVVYAGISAALITGCESSHTPYSHSSPITEKPVTPSQPATQPAAAQTPKPAPAHSPSGTSGSVATPGVDANLPAYQTAQVVSGPLRSVGSDSMDRLMQLWEAEFRKVHPDLVVRHEGKGSGTALPALMKGLSDIGPMSRPVTNEEVASFNQRFNHAPIQVPVALDALAVVVHPSNPIAKKGLTFEQLDAIFSSTRKRGGAQDMLTWGQAGLTGSWADAPIVVCSRNKASGTYAFFREHVLKKGDFKTTNQELPGSQEVINAVAANPYAIGFCSVGYVSPAVLATSLSADTHTPPVAPDSAAVYSNRYPLARYFYLTVNYGPDQPLTPQTQEFIRFALSKDGQTLVLKEGLYPLQASQARAELAKLKLNP